MKYLNEIALLFGFCFYAYGQTNDWLEASDVSYTMLLFKADGNRIMAEKFSPAGEMINVRVDQSNIMLFAQRGVWIMNGEDVVFQMLPPIRSLPFAEPQVVDGLSLTARFDPHESTRIRFRPYTPFQLMCVFNDEDAQQCLVITGSVFRAEQQALVGTNVVMKWGGSWEETSESGHSTLKIAPPGLTSDMMQQRRLMQQIEAMEITDADLKRSKDLHQPVRTLPMSIRSDKP